MHVEASVWKFIWQRGVSSHTVVTSRIPSKSIGLQSLSLCRCSAYFVLATNPCFLLFSLLWKKFNNWPTLLAAVYVNIWSDEVSWKGHRWECFSVSGNRCVLCVRAAVWIPPLYKLTTACVGIHFSGEKLQSRCRNNYSSVFLKLFILWL